MGKQILVDKSPLLYRALKANKRSKKNAKPKVEKAFEFCFLQKEPSILEVKNQVTSNLPKLPLMSTDVKYIDTHQKATNIFENPEQAPNMQILQRNRADFGQPQRINSPIAIIEQTNWNYPSFGHLGIIENNVYLGQNIGTPTRESYELPNDQNIIVEGDGLFDEMEIPQNVGVEIINSPEAGNSMNMLDLLLEDALLTTESGKSNLLA